MATYPHGHTKHGYSNTTEHETLRALRKRRTGAWVSWTDAQRRHCFVNAVP